MSKIIPTNGDAIFETYSHSSNNEKLRIYNFRSEVLLKPGDTILLCLKNGKVIVTRLVGWTEYCLICDDIQIKFGNFAYLVKLK